MSLTMQDIIAKVGKGEKASKDLTYQEATAAMRLLLEKRATPVQIQKALEGDYREEHLFVL